MNHAISKGGGVNRSPRHFQTAETGKRLDASAPTMSEQEQLKQPPSPLARFSCSFIFVCCCCCCCCWLLLLLLLLLVVVVGCWLLVVGGVADVVAVYEVVVAVAGVVVLFLFALICFAVVLRLIMLFVLFL